ncbi:hypothetical protein MU516_11070 [Paracoccus sp. YLB-12]|uniref:Uncharacterized protein n=1 Tax=Paracoccus maritimus TaxID=2933292 RepID=A0ABT2KBP3_9RHOB|nr:hypothetical protein [Paracoccus sp. YLB-12]MCT4333404.1 hypothetical protein [Paracoccus sp. YLB-12]
MIGVVVWSSDAREKAVIWCEDQGALAYLQGRDNLICDRRWPEPGDLLELDCELIGDLRHARDVSILSEQVCPHLPGMLRKVHCDKSPARQLRLVASREPDEILESCPAPTLRVGAVR